MPALRQDRIEDESRWQTGELYYKFVRNQSKVGHQSHAFHEININNVYELTRWQVTKKKKNHNNKIKKLTHGRIQ